MKNILDPHTQRWMGVGVSDRRQICVPSMGTVGPYVVLCASVPPAVMTPHWVLLREDDYPSGGLQCKGSKGTVEDRALTQKVKASFLHFPFPSSTGKSEHRRELVWEEMVATCFEGLSTTCI